MAAKRRTEQKRVVLEKPASQVGNDAGDSRGAFPDRVGGFSASTAKTTEKHEAPVAAGTSQQKGVCMGLSDVSVPDDVHEGHDNPSWQPLDLNELDLPNELTAVRQAVSALPFQPWDPRRPWDPDPIGEQTTQLLRRWLEEEAKQRADRRKITEGASNRARCLTPVNRVLRYGDGTVQAVSWRCRKCVCCREANTSEWIDRLPNVELWRLEIGDEDWRSVQCRLKRRGIRALQIPVVDGERHVYAEAPLDGSWTRAGAEEVRESLGLRLPADPRRPRASDGFLAPSDRQEREAAKVRSDAMVIGAWDPRMSVDEALHLSKIAGLVGREIVATEEVSGGVEVENGWDPERDWFTSAGAIWIGFLGFRPFRHGPVPIGEWQKSAPEDWQHPDEPPWEVYEEPDPQMQLEGVAA